MWGKWGSHSSAQLFKGRIELSLPVCSSSAKEGSAVSHPRIVLTSTYMYLPNWKRGQPAALDVTVISTIQQLTIAGASTTQGHALSVGEERKMAAHAEACGSVGVSFNPLVVETIGGWSDWAADTIQSFGRLLGQRLGIPSSDSTTHLFQRLSICLWRGNATMWIRCTPIRPPEVDGVV